MKQTKIVASISDLRCEVDFLRELHNSGVNVFRINTAHATPEGIKRVINNIREVSRYIAILIDTKGPEIRTTAVEEHIYFNTGDKVMICGNPSEMTTRECINVSYQNFVHDLNIGNDVLFDDGELSLKIVDKDEDCLHAVVQNDGRLGSRKSVNVPGVHIELPALTEKDKANIKLAIEEDIDFIAHSFVRSKDDVKAVQDILDEYGSDIKIISKIENQEGVDNIDEIIEASYGIMIARGDLGIEVPIENIPGIQRRIIRQCVIANKPVIVATQMLHSMIENPRPTRAEVSDIANAIFQRTDAIMLSGETAGGHYPVEAVETMSRIAAEAEKSVDVSLDLQLNNVLKPIAATLAHNLVEASTRLPVKAIIFDTWTGRTGRYLAEFRPKVPVYAMCYQDSTMRELALTFGIEGYSFGIKNTKEEMVRNAIEILVTDGKISKGDLVAFIGGSFNDALGANYMEFKYID